MLTPIQIATAIGSPITLFEPPKQRLSSRATFYGDHDRLVVVAHEAPQSEPKTALKYRRSNSDLAVAYGLAYVGNRDLWIVVPEGMQAAALARAAFIEVPMRIWSYAANDVNEHVIPAPIELLSASEGPVGAVELELDEARAAWIAPIAEWAVKMPGLSATPRKGYLEWLCDGRAVLRVRPTSDGIEVIAGVNYSKPTPGQPVPYKNTFKEFPTAEQMHRIVEAAARAAADRLAGIDKAHEEHRLQSLLHERDLKLVRMDREFPAMRPGEYRGFIDFLGVDSRRGIHVVETKIGPDAMLVLQGLDYWIWARANQAKLDTHFSLEQPSPRVVIDYVVSSKDDGAPPIGPYTAAQAEALVGSVGWRFHVVEDWHDGTPKMKGHPSRTIPGDTPRVGNERRFALELQEHLLNNAAGAGFAVGPNHHHKVQSAGLVPAAALIAAELTGQGLDHDRLQHVRSSQAFALNLFAGLDGNARRGIFNELGIDAGETEAPVFEYSDPDDQLAERTHASPHATQVDVMMACTTTGGEKHVALIEVKLSEPGFSPCSAYRSKDNDRRDVCHQDGPFGNDPSACFQLRNHNREERRRYDLYLGQLQSPAHQSSSGCWFRIDNQVMRNVALARVLIERGDADHVTVALCAPERHRVIWRYWAEAKARLGAIDGVSLADLPAPAVLQRHTGSDAALLAVRYQLEHLSISS